MLGALRMMWKDWGFAESLFAQSRMFLTLAEGAQDAVDREAHIRAAIVFSQMAFEAYFRSTIGGYIQDSSRTFPPGSVKKVKDGMRANTGICEALREWPKWLTGKPVATNTATYRNFGNFVKYRNALVHGHITAKIPSWGKLAQEVETAKDARLAYTTSFEMVRLVATHLSVVAPNWLE